MDNKAYIEEKGKRSKEAARTLGNTATNIKNKALNMMAEALIQNVSFILNENKKDMETGQDKGLSRAMLDRLLLNEKRIADMAEGLRQIAALPDPIGEVTKGFQRPNGLRINQVRVPFGVIGIIYEARPNVTVDAAGLCIKSGNAVLLRGGSEALNSNKAIAEIIAKAGDAAGLPENSIQYIDIKDREAVNIMLKLNSYIDVLIPRGGAGLIRNVVQNATVPVIETGVGNCHVYVDSDADLSMAEDIIINAKTQRPAVCNAMETLLVHKDCYKELLEKLAPKLVSLGVEIRGCEKTQALIKAAVPASKEDWSTEFLDLILAVKIVDSLDEAIEHIYKYGTKHSEAIITNNYFNSQRFLKEIDAAAVYVNASTRFTDGFEFGFGGEIGISTQKLHARGPMGLEQLTSIKYMIYGEGQVR
ncbi:glutamate-5-semialdehyde dehydrogenase [Clostridium swellfunianum]|uniref:glutamate-5-semialdehyde dehydrogenase n=1 Tax=Clostridium swellfunianum TaxID=1367462 RepID=UPI00202EACE0|nr:glutamate-5-semialdehyde dehydrogenase [Clostridium swellfunianum]MCM0649340.1 glutamate-5-semialdehyde dehydrogenase [Clostridium swellfunianum]